MEIKIKGERINLRKLKPSDTEFIYQNAKDKKVTRFTFVIPPPFTLKRAKEFIQKTQKEWRKKKAFEFGIKFKKTKELIGTIKLSEINSKNKNANVGFWLSSKYWGRHLAKEALELILDFGFKKLKLKRIQARVLDKNFRAQKLLEKSGFKLEGRLRKATFFKNRWYDDLIYGLLNEEYQKYKRKIRFDKSSRTNRIRG